MTEQNPPSEPPAAQPNPHQPAPGQQQNPYQRYQPTPKKPPLPREQKRAASVAGAVSFTVMSLGWGLLSTAAGIGLFAGFFTWILSIVSAAPEARDADYFRLMDMIDAINPAAWVIPLILAGVIGIGLWVLSLFISRGMLARSGHPSPWGVTWAGAGTAIAASWFVSWIAWLPMQLIGVIVPDAFSTFESGLTITIVVATVSLLLGLLITIALGWLAWWWMAHAMRAAAQPTSPQPDSQP